MAGALIWFVCEAVNHRNPGQALRATDTPLTIHDRQWAYCPAGGLSEHDWTRIVPVGLEYLKPRYAGWVVAEHPSRLDPQHGG